MKTILKKVLNWICVVVFTSLSLVSCGGCDRDDDWDYEPPPEDPDEDYFFVSDTKRPKSGLENGNDYVSVTMDHRGDTKWVHVTTNYNPSEIKFQQKNIESWGNGAKVRRKLVNASMIIDKDGGSEYPAPLNTKHPVYYCKISVTATYNPNFQDIFWTLMLSGSRQIEEIVVDSDGKKTKKKKKSVGKYCEIDVSQKPTPMITSDVIKYVRW